ncbi:MAG: LysM peptidoglycan-binding domain-containing protein [Phycisphaerae bacterium]|jgi:N-acetylmuramoyl-L-alanine amidase
MSAPIPAAPKSADEFSKRLQSMLGGKGSAAHLVDAIPKPSPVTAWPAPGVPASAARQPPGADQRPDAAPVGTGDHVVKSGECVASIARDTGHFWQTIWDDVNNAEIKSVRRQPNVLLPGDRLFVPPIRRKDEPGATEMRHRFVRRGEPSHLKLRVMDEDVPRGNQPYKLVIDEKQTITGFTDPDGKLDIPIPGNARKGLLEVGEAPDLYRAVLNLGGLDPVSSWRGVQARLKNMGYECQETGEKDEQTLDALNEFRAASGLTRADDMDDATRTEIERKHGS